MATVTENDLKKLEDLIIASREENRQRFTGLEQGQIEIKERLKVIETRLEDWKPSIEKTADLAEKVGELKNWRSIAFLILGAIAGWIARNSMGNNP